MVGGDDDAAALGDPVVADHDDPPIEKPQEKADQRPDGAIRQRAAVRLA